MPLYSSRNSIRYRNSTTDSLAVGYSRASRTYNRDSARFMFQFFYLSVMFFFSAPLLANSNENSMAVVYPKVREPYNKIFISIINEIKASTDNKVLVYEVEKSGTSKKLAKWIHDKNIKKIVGLGNRGIRTVYKLDNKSNWPIVFGASAINPEKSHGFFALSLVPEPMKLFEKLRELSKDIKTIHVVYETGKQDELIRLSTLSAELLGFELVSYGASDVVEMAEMYREVLKNINSKTDALWMSKSGRSIEKAIMNEILRGAWKKRFIVFSSNLADVGKGALFSLFPNNSKIGEKLVEMLDEVQKKPEMKPQVVLSDNLKAGLNIRTAAHLGIHFSEEERRAYSLIFPPQQ